MPLRSCAFMLCFYPWTLWNSGLVGSEKFSLYGRLPAGDTPALAAMDIEDAASQPTTNPDDSDGEWPLHQLDESIFDAAWKRQIEQLDSHDDSALFESSSADGFLPLDWQMDYQTILQSLTTIGMDDRRLLLQKGEELTVVAQVLAYLGMEPEPQEAQWLRRQLSAKILQIERSEPMAKRLRGEHLSPALQDLLHGQIPDRTKPEPASKATIHELLDELPSKGTRRRTSFGPQHVPASREEAEKQVQKFWATEFLGLMRLSEAPILEMVADSTDPLALLFGAMGSTRGSTMESYHKALSPLLRWLSSTHGLEWPSSVVHVLDFLHMAGNKPCAPSFPQRFLQALSWFEKVGGWTGPSKHSDQALVLSTIRFWQEGLRAGLEPVKQAPRLPWAVVAALELFVCSDQQPDRLRYKAWTLLLKVWGTLREDDLQHISPGKFRVMGELLVTELMRSKTTGAAKRIRQLPVAISMEVTLTRSLWLETGLGLMDKLTQKTADFLLPSFGKDGAPRNTPMTYAESAGLTRVVLSKLTLPEFDEDSLTWSLSLEPIMSAELCQMFTEHSGRPVLPTAAQCLQFSKDESDHLGRWSPGGANEYARAYRIVVQNIQTKVRDAVQRCDRRLLEHEILDRVVSWGAGRGWDESRISAEKASMQAQFERFWKEMKKAGGPTDEATVSQPSLLPKPPVVKALPTPASIIPKFLIVYGRKRKTAKLHRIGGCPWTSVQLADSQEIVIPSPELYDSRCKQCWPKLLERSMENEFNEPSSGSDF